MNTEVTLVWFRHDLRLSDNPALKEAADRGLVVPVYIWSPSDDKEWAPGSASRWWLHRSLNALDQRLRKKKSRLTLRTGPALATLKRLIKETHATRVAWNRSYEPAAAQRDKKIMNELRAMGLEVESFNGTLLREPWDVSTASGTPYQVFTPYWSAHQSQPPIAAPLREPATLPAPSRWPLSLPLNELALEPKVNWAAGFGDVWKPGEAGARASLRRFLRRVEDYSVRRDIPAESGTTRLSPHLHFGEISPREIWNSLERLRRSIPHPRGIDTLQKELGWREFAAHLLFYFPHTSNQPLRQRFAQFPWKQAPKELRQWQTGRTGYPIVDAGMRELWTTGWMHNRVRMIAASFLVKDLRISWLEGARWFWDTLVDADLANNTLGWQWAAGCGADAAPYFRIFNPVLQGKRFDANGTYVKRWVPELKTLPARWIHAPWDAPPTVLANSGVILGQTYPRPVVDHAKARAQALAAFKTVSSNRKKTPV